MGCRQKNLVILFRELQPEHLYRCMGHGGASSAKDDNVLASGIDLELFCKLAPSQYLGYSYEEVQNIHKMLMRDFDPLDSGAGSGPSVFNVVARVGMELLVEKEEGICCDYAKIMKWQNIYQPLGQDLFTTAFLAYRDCLFNKQERSDLTWNAVLRTDNDLLSHILRKGIAENHCHLGGTSQNLPLSWAAVMNYGDALKDAVRNLESNLHAHLSRGVSGNVWNWAKRLEWASLLRIQLFKRLAGSNVSPADYQIGRLFNPLGFIASQQAALRASYGARVSVPGGKTFVLDYALRKEDYMAGFAQEHNRLLSGERSFLYRAFRACFSGFFNSDEQNWLYLYLLLKESFRAELVQTNRQVGFKNFRDYQDRKDVVYDRYDAYAAEATRLAVNVNQQTQTIASFEARVGPKARADVMVRQIDKLERHIAFAGGDCPGSQHFYVYHFIKQPDDGGHRDQPRNLHVRKSVRNQAICIASALRRSAKFAEKVRGIDAANIEIGCRPETFATEFRYLRNVHLPNRRNSFLPPATGPSIGVTYHVGEDFLDIADGLRAIDEAVKFLHMGRGDRLGHALALGVDPSLHYRLKCNRILISKQDALDNMVWLLFRSSELGVSISSKLRLSLEVKSRQYMLDIYGNLINERGLNLGLFEYYCSMRLRGDHPDLYRTLSYKDPPHAHPNAYEGYKRDSNRQLRPLRRSIPVAFLCQAYHYDEEARRAGHISVEIPVTDEYASLMAAMQNGLARELVSRGIMVECNLTSNYLIGTFRRYEKHPIFRFNGDGLVRSDGRRDSTMQLNVSINTDDAGVFDTSLENEYALLARCLEEQQEEGKPVYEVGSIYAYINNVREMGLSQVFRKGEPIW